MKKILLIVVIIVSILLVGALLFFFLNRTQTPDSTDVGADFNIDGSDINPRNLIPENPEDGGNVQIQPALTKLTDRPVAGAAFIERDGRTYVRYAVQGLGHMYEISLTDGNEELISGTTIPKTVEAHWSPTGLHVALVTEIAPYEYETFLATLTKDNAGRDTIEGFTLPKGSQDPQWNETGDTLHYALVNSQGAVGYAYDVETETTSTQFETPLTQIKTIWDTRSKAIYVLTKPTSFLTGYLYEITGTETTRVGRSGRGLMADVLGNNVLMSTSEESEIRTVVIDTGATEKTDLLIEGYAEKCTFSYISNTTLWCGGQLNGEPGIYPDNWYKGITIFDDFLWKISLDDGTHTLLSIPEEDAGEQLDITNMTAHIEDEYLLFTNKTDGTLWLYNLDETTSI